MQVGVCVASLDLECAVIGTTGTYVQYSSQSDGCFYIDGLTASSNETGYGMLLVLLLYVCVCVSG